LYKVLSFFWNFFHLLTAHVSLNIPIKASILSNRIQVHSIIMSDSTTQFVFYHYTPSLAAAAIFVILFLATALLHLFQLFKNSTWYFIPFVIGGFCKFSTACKPHRSNLTVYKSSLLGMSVAQFPASNPQTGRQGHISPKACSHSSPQPYSQLRST
jgi:hypothetical protein